MGLRPRRRESFGRIVSRTITAVIVIGLAIIVLATTSLLRDVPFLGNTRSAARATLEILGKEDVLWLTTTRTTAQIVSEIAEDSPILGPRQGIAVAKVEIQYGIDLAEIAPTDVVQRGDEVYVKMPVPRVLQVSVDTGSIRFFTRQTGLQYLWVALSKEDIREPLLRKLQEDGRAFAEQQATAVVKSDIARRLESFLNTRKLRAHVVDALPLDEAKS
jgi:hypothetical protein